jgi:hypothetical protein
VITIFDDGPIKDAHHPKKQKTFGCTSKVITTNHPTSLL